MKWKVQLCFYHIIDIAVLGVGLLQGLNFIAKLNSYYFPILKSREQFCD